METRPGSPTKLSFPRAHSVLDAELEAVLLSKAAQFGLPGEWVSRLDQLDPERRQVRVAIRADLHADHCYEQPRLHSWDA